MRTARPKLGRFAAILVAIAAVLVLASRLPVNAGGVSSFLPEAAGLSISIPLGDTGRSTERPNLQVFAVVDGGEQVRFDVGRQPTPYRVAFADFATIGSLAGVAAWRSAHAPITARGQGAPRATHNKQIAGTTTKRRRSAARPTKTFHRKAAEASLTNRQIRRTARQAATSYRRLLKAYMSRRHIPSAEAAVEHARLVKAYRVAMAWRRRSGLR